MMTNRPTKEQILQDKNSINGNSYVTRLSIPYTDLSKRNMDCSHFYSVDMRGSLFNLSSMIKTQIEYSKVDGGDFSNADMTKFFSKRTSFRNAYFYLAYLERSRFEYCDMRGADFSDAELTHSSFAGTDLREASFSCATIGNVNFSEANGVLCLPMHDARGYRPIAIAHRSGWMVYSGCRTCNVDDAKDHWGTDYMGRRAVGDGYLRALDWLEQQPLPSFDDWSEPEMPKMEDSK